MSESGQGSSEYYHLASKFLVPQKQFCDVGEELEKKGIKVDIENADFSTIRYVCERLTDSNNFEQYNAQLAEQILIDYIREENGDPRDAYIALAKMHMNCVIEFNPDYSLSMKYAAMAEDHSLLEQAKAKVDRKCSIEEEARKIEEDGKSGDMGKFTSYKHQIRDLMSPSEKVDMMKKRLCFECDKLLQRLESNSVRKSDILNKYAKGRNA